MKYIILRRFGCVLLFIFVYGNGQFLDAVEPEDILAPAIGPVVILPKASLSVNYEDNVFLESDDSQKTDDYMTTFSPGFGLQYGQNILDSNYIALDYSPSLKWYAENDDLNTDNHSLGFLIRYEKKGKYIFSGSDQITLDNSLLRGRERSFFSSLGNEQKGNKGVLVQRFASLDRYRFEYIISPKTSFYVATQLDMVDYEEEPHYYYQNVFGGLVPFSLFDVSNWRNTAGFGWQAFPKVKFYGSLFYGITQVDTNLASMGLRPDSDVVGGHIQAAGNFSEKLTGTLEVGYQVREFDRLSNVFGGNSHGLPIFNAQLNYEYTTKGEAALGYLRTGSVSVESPNLPVESDYLTISVSQGLGITGKFKATLNSAIRLDSFETVEGLNNRFYRFNAGMSYNFNPWLKSSLTYGLEYFDSSKGSIDYSASRIMLGVSVGYN